VLVLRLMRQTGLSFLTKKPEHRRPGRKPSKECATVRHYIDNHFKENINLNLLSELVHVNKYYMVHSFTKEYGISPINYLISRRIEESKYLLGDTDHSLSQISHMLGFSSPSYFSQSFRRLEGMSPMEYRKTSRTKAGA
jgi:AraC-like DNA-binding protein